MAGCSCKALTTAQPMRWVKLTLPPSVRRASWLLRILRLTSSSLAGRVLMDVAVGSSLLASMRSAMIAAPPRSASSFSLGFGSRTGGAEAAGVDGGTRSTCDATGGGGAVRRGSAPGAVGADSGVLSAIAALGSGGPAVEVRSPRLADGVRGFEVPLVHVLDDPGVGSEVLGRRGRVLLHACNAT